MFNLCNSALLIFFSGVNIDVLAAHELNGRQIKNVIKIAQALALDDEVSITTAHFENAIRFTSQFRLDLQG